MYGPLSVNAESSVPSLLGKSGRTLSLNPMWVANNPSGQWFVGSKLAFDLYPKSLKKRVRAARKEQWIRTHKQCEANVQRDIACPLARAEDAEELGARLAQLKALGDLSESEGGVGPVLDCVMWHDGELWQGAVDTLGVGDLSQCESMTDYKVKRQYARISEEDAMNYCLNIFPDEGGAEQWMHTLSIVVDAGDHGSHVAGIVAAHHPDAPERNGVAPGAQIVSLKIGDSRLGSMETGTAMVRALIAAVNSGVHVINMSYGEAVAVSNTGAFVKLLETLVNDYGIIFVSSAGIMLSLLLCLFKRVLYLCMGWIPIGNNGPALSTVGSPGGTSSCSIGVGAYATQSLMKSAYSM